MIKIYYLLKKGRLAEWLMQRTANPFTLVRFRYRPPKKRKKMKKVLAKKNYLLYLFHYRFWRSSAVELSAVNRSVVGSNPTARANLQHSVDKEPQTFSVLQQLPNGIQVVPVGQ